MSGDPSEGERPGAGARPAPVVDARRVEGRAPAAGEFSYTVLVPPRAPASKAARPASPAKPDAAPRGDKRHASRQRTRLRTGKIIDRAGRFVTECLVFDRSDGGSRLRLPEGVTLQAGPIQFYDDQGGTLSQAEVVWRTAREIGIRFRAAAATPESRALAAEMRRRYYAVPK